MEGVKEQSGILTWSKENVVGAPKTQGVLVLRFSPVNGDILHIEQTNNLEESLTKFLDQGPAGLKFFEWYSTESMDAATELAKFLSERHGLHQRPTEAGE